MSDCLIVHLSDIGREAAQRGSIRVEFWGEDQPGVAGFLLFCRSVSSQYRVLDIESMSSRLGRYSAERLFPSPDINDGRSDAGLSGWASG